MGDLLISTHDQQLFTVDGPFVCNCHAEGRLCSPTWESSTDPASAVPDDLSASLRGFCLDRNAEPFFSLGYTPI